MTTDLAHNMADHPWAGDDDGHNCVDCLASGDSLRMCMRVWHVIPRWDDDPVAVANGWVEGRCGICGSESHDDAEHRQNGAPA